MGFPQRFRHPVSGVEVEAQTKGEANQLRYGQGFAPVEEQEKRAKPSPTPRQRPTDSVEPAQAPAE